MKYCVSLLFMRRERERERGRESAGCLHHARQGERFLPALSFVSLFIPVGSVRCFFALLTVSPLGRKELGALRFVLFDLLASSVCLLCLPAVASDRLLYWVRTYRERCQIIVITITNNNFRLRYVSSKLDQVLLLLLLTNKL
jgi:hypothetical protein